MCDVYIKDLKFAVSKEIIEEFHSYKFDNDKNNEKISYDLDRNKILDLTEFSTYKKVLPSPLIEGVVNAEYFACMWDRKIKNNL